MKVLLIDDEELQLLRLEKEARLAFGEKAEFFTFSNPLEAIKELGNTMIDVAFLDIEMPGMNGIMLAKALKKINPLINIIFVTAYDNYALEAYKLHASGYLSKPVSASKIKEEIEALRYPIVLDSDKKIQVKCFGNFEIFYQGQPIKFAYQKSKELFAYLIDREGSAINVNELNAVLWEEDHPSYLRNLIADIQQTLKSYNSGDIFVKQRNQYSIDVNKIYCDAYEYKKGNPNAIRLYRGEYMSQYPWALFKD